MKLSNNDIGGELISIITKGMYTDPKDALREYVQNGVDAGADTIEIKIRANRIIVHDYGHGMNVGIMRRAVRVGMSDKNPKFSVGFMGIGLYSSFHLCDTLTIYSKVDGQSPNGLTFDFKGMRDVLDAQKDARIDRVANADNEDNKQVALLPLLETFITFESLSDQDFPNVGTRVEMSGVEESFFMSLSKFEEVAEYLEKVVPLPFHPDFKYGPEIQQYIDNACSAHGAQFKIMNLVLDINGKSEPLYRPYKDSDFAPSTPQPPNFKELTSDTEFFGVSWGCLNSSNSVIPTVSVRGFLLRKQGFALGARNNMLATFGAKFFNRYVGEIIVVHPKLLPNGARNDFEYSSLRTSFYTALKDVAEEYNSDANAYQEQEKAENELSKLIDFYRETRGQLRYFENNGDKLLELYKLLSTKYSSFEKRRRTDWKIRPNIKDEADKTMHLVGELIDEVRGLIEAKKEEKKRKPTPISTVAKKLNEAPLPRPQVHISRNPTSLAEVVELIGYPFSDEIKQIFDLLEEQFIKPSTKTEEDFINLLINLKSDIEDLFEVEE